MFLKSLIYSNLFTFCCSVVCPRFLYTFDGKWRTPKDFRKGDTCKGDGCMLDMYEMPNKEGYYFNSSCIHLSYDLTWEDMYDEFRKYPLYCKTEHYARKYEIFPFKCFCYTNYCSVPIVLDRIRHGNIFEQVYAMTYANEKQFGGVRTC